MSTADRVGMRAWVTAGVIAVAAALIGFVWLPSIQEGAQNGVWDAICRAVGITRPAGAAPLASAASQTPTELAWNVDTLRVAVSGDAKRGSALAAACAGCHGANGGSPSD